MPKVFILSAKMKDSLTAMSHILYRRKTHKLSLNKRPILGHISHLRDSSNQQRGRTTNDEIGPVANQIYEKWSCLICYMSI